MDQAEVFIVVSTFLELGTGFFNDHKRKLLLNELSDDQDLKNESSYYERDSTERQNCYATESFTTSGTLKLISAFHCIKKEANCEQLCCALLSTATFFQMVH